MPYEYTDPTQESDPHALPDVEVFNAEAYLTRNDPNWSLSGFTDPGFYWVSGSPGCLWDSDPVGPFETYELALADAREGVE
jgi:hypothetical protein